MEAGNVFSQDVKLKIHDAPDLEGVKVGVFESVGDDADLETVGGRLADGEADAIVRHALVDFQLRGEGAAQGEVFVGGFRSHGDDLCGAFNNS